MTSGRNQVDYTDIRYDGLTYKIDNSTIVYDEDEVNGSAAVGKAVAYSANDTVKLAGDGDHIVGKLIKVESDNFCTVQDHGFVTLPGGTSATLTRGKKIVGDLGGVSTTDPGYIRDVVVAAGTYAAAEANEMQKARGRIVNVADATAVVVEL